MSRRFLEQCIWGAVIARYHITWRHQRKCVNDSLLWKVSRCKSEEAARIIFGVRNRPSKGAEG